MRRANKYPLVRIPSRKVGRAFSHLAAVSAVLALAFAPSTPVFAGGLDFGFGTGSGGSAKCFLSGSIRPLNGSSTKRGFQSLENRLRLTFDANDPQTCERYIKSYCQNNILGKGDVPVKLTGYFRPAREIASEADKKPTHLYEVTEACKLVVE